MLLPPSLLSASSLAAGFESPTAPTANECLTVALRFAPPSASGSGLVGAWLFESVIGPVSSLTFDAADAPLSLAPSATSSTTVTSSTTSTSTASSAPQPKSRGRPSKAAAASAATTSAAVSSDSTSTVSGTTAARDPAVAALWAIHAAAPLLREQLASYKGLAARSGKAKACPRLRHASWSISHSRSTVRRPWLWLGESKCMRLVHLMCVASRRLRCAATWTFSRSGSFWRFCEAHSP